MRRVYFILSFIFSLLLVYADHYIDGYRIHQMEECNFGGYWAHLYPFVQCGGACYYKGEEIDECLDLWPVTFTAPAIFVLAFALLPDNEGELDDVFFHYIVQVGFWYCIINFSKRPIPFPQLVASEGTKLGFVVPMLHIIYEKTELKDVIYKDYNFLLFFIIYWVCGINLDNINKWLDLELTLTGNFFKADDKRALVLFLVIFPTVFVYQVWKTYQNNRLKWSVIYVLWALVSITPFIILGMQIHIHHYLFALFLMPLLTGDKPITVMVWGALVGTFINGVAVWGADPLFY